MQESKYSTRGKKKKAAVVQTPTEVYSIPTKKGSESNDHLKKEDADLEKLNDLMKALNLKRSAKSVSFGLNLLEQEKTKSLGKSYNSAPAALENLEKSEKPVKRMKR